MPSEYCIKAEIVYSVDLYAWDRKACKWTAFDNAEAQLEFTMLDPYYRVPLVQTARGNPTYTAELRAPDRFGVFQFKINYTRKGYTSLDVATKVTAYAKNPSYRCR
ncbi:MAG: hypothetical protein P4L10_02160 [Acidobacteriaceae bacterium]|nr:hypothetical protein [Acidobacteriaceae bacterium]